jgi:hypothetical protein
MARLQPETRLAPTTRAGSRSGGRVDEKGYLDAWEERLFELTDRLGGEHDGYER